MGGPYLPERRAPTDVAQVPTVCCPTASSSHSTGGHSGPLPSTTSLGPNQWLHRRPDPPSRAGASPSPSLQRKADKERLFQQAGQGCGFRLGCWGQGTVHTPLPQCEGSGAVSALGPGAPTQDTLREGTGMVAPRQGASVGRAVGGPGRNWHGL